MIALLRSAGFCLGRVLFYCRVIYWLVMFLHGIGLLSLIVLRDVVMVALCVLINHSDDLLVGFPGLRAARVAFHGE